VSREVYVNEEIYQEELERIFTRAWLFVGHESQVPNPNDYVMSMMGSESVVLTRSRDNKLHVFLNTCRHRGMKVVRYDAGSTPVFTCPYHAWSYSTDGSLVEVPGALIGVPSYRDAYREQLDKVEWGLVNVAQLVNHKGSIWATWDPHAPSFEDYMGDMLMYLDILLDAWDGGDGGSEVVGGVIKWRLPSNWKFPAENAGGDPLHTISHRSVEIAGIGPGGVGSQRNGQRRNAGRKPPHGHISFDLGHSLSSVPPHAQYEEYDDNPFPTFESPVGPLDNPAVVGEYFKEINELRRERLKGKVMPPIGGTARLFPNLFFHGSGFPRDILVFQPLGPFQTECWRWLVVDKGAPKEVKDLLRHHYIRYSGPGGMTEQDDMENWNYATAASRGPMARRYPYNNSLRIGQEEPAAGLQGAWWAATPSEHTQRGFWKRWSEFMDAGSWDQLMPPGPLVTR
jgi:nitrite reductase/ring-hydroxylating ferredoxin subunit